MSLTGTHPTTRVVKRLAPHQHGALKHARRFGERLVCVRYRHDLAARRRYTTVELIVDEGPIRDTPTRLAADRTIHQMVAIRLAPHEKSLRRAIEQRGALWDPSTQTWYLRLRVAKTLGLLHRIV